LSIFSSGVTSPPARPHSAHSTTRWGSSSCRTPDT
jgi:hypothetical protein